MALLYGGAPQVPESYYRTSLSDSNFFYETNLDMRITIYIKQYRYIFTCVTARVLLTQCIEAGIPNKEVETGFEKMYA